MPFNSSLVPLEVLFQCPPLTLTYFVGWGLNMSEQQIPFITATKFKIFQVADNGALANCEENINTIPSFSGPVVFIPSDGDNQFYDDQIIEVPKNKKVMQVGTFRYLTRLGEKVVPVIKFM